MIEARQQTVSVWWQIHTNNICFLVSKVIQESWVLMCKSVVILLPYIRSKDKVQRSDWLSPGKLVCNFDPFSMLCCHRVNYTDECFVRSEESMTTCQQVSFQPSLAHMLRKHTVHDTAVCSKVVIIAVHICIPRTILYFKCMIQTVGHRLIWSKDTEVLVLFI